MLSDVDVTEASDHDHRPWWLRLRAAAGLSVLVVVLGMAAAALVGVAALAFAALFDRALG